MEEDGDVFPKEKNGVLGWEGDRGSRKGGGREQGERERLTKRRWRGAKTFRSNCAAASAKGCVAMRIIDAHVHIYPPEVNRAPAVWAEAQGERHWAMLCTRVRKNGRPVQGFPSVDELLREMDAAGIERAVLQGWYWEKHDTCMLQNRFYADCIRAHPDRLAVFATFHPKAGVDVVKGEIRRAMDEGFCGLGELSPHSQGVAMDDPAWREALGLAGELNLPVNLHVTEPLSKIYPGKVATPLGDFVRMACEFPSTKFILAHWGARLPLDLELGAAAKACANLFYDTAASPLLYDTRVFREMIDKVGVERVLYGTDHPLDLYPQHGSASTVGAMLDEVRAAGLSEAELAAVLGQNAIGLLRL
jgi:predicted TIM-barrel fold metal-dependent hydrolase